MAGALSNIKRTLKGSPLIGRDKALMEPIQKKGSRPGLLVAQSKDWQPVLNFPLPSSGFTSFIDKGSPDHKPTAFAQSQLA